MVFKGVFAFLALKGVIQRCTNPSKRQRFALRCARLRLLAMKHKVKAFPRIYLANFSALFYFKYDGVLLLTLKRDVWPRLKKNARR